MNATQPTSPSESTRAAPLIGRRLLAMLYDAFPILALWILISALYTALYWLTGHDRRENIPPFSLWQWLLWLSCWLVTGLYLTISWRRGGQTLGMRPWHIRLTANPPDTPPSWKTLGLRYLVATFSLACAGLGFWWAWFDSERLTWHDRISRTRMVRVPKISR